LTIRQESAVCYSNTPVSFLFALSRTFAPPIASGREGGSDLAMRFAQQNALRSGASVRDFSEAYVGTSKLGLCEENRSGCVRDLKWEERKMEKRKREWRRKEVNERFC